MKARLEKMGVKPTQAKCRDISQRMENALSTFGSVCSMIKCSLDARIKIPGRTKYPLHQLFIFQKNLPLHLPAISPLGQQPNGQESSGGGFKQYAGRQYCVIPLVRLRKFTMSCVAGRSQQLGSQQIPLNWTLKEQKVSGGHTETLDMMLLLEVEATSKVEVGWGGSWGSVANFSDGDSFIRLDYCPNRKKCQQKATPNPE